MVCALFARLITFCLTGKLRHEPGLEDGPYRNISEQQVPPAPPADEANRFASCTVSILLLCSSVLSPSRDQRTMPVRTWNDQALAENKPFERPRVVLAAVLGGFVHSYSCSSTGRIQVH